MTSLWNPVIFESITTLLDQHKIIYKQIEHEPTLTSADSAKARGEELKVWWKALLIKVNKAFSLFVMSAEKKLDTKKMRAHLWSKKSRFATHEELKEMTGLVPWSVPPFGEPRLPVPLYVDMSITKNKKIAFNAGMLTQSLILDVKDYLTVADPEIFDFCE